MAAVCMIPSIEPLVTDYTGLRSFSNSLASGAREQPVRITKRRRPWWPPPLVGVGGSVRESHPVSIQEVVLHLNLVEEIVFVVVRVLVGVLVLASFELVGALATVEAVLAG